MSQSIAHRRDYISCLTWESLRVPQKELEHVAREEDFALPAVSADKDGWRDEVRLLLLASASELCPG